MKSDVVHKKSQPSKEVAYEISRVRREQKSLMSKGTPASARKAFDYKNMLGVCDGGRRIYKSATEGSHRVLCCDASKGSRAIPCKREHMMKIRYSEDGGIYIHTPKMKSFRRTSTKCCI